MLMIEITQGDINSRFLNELQVTHACKWDFIFEVAGHCFVLHIPDLRDLQDEDYAV